MQINELRELGIVNRFDTWIIGCDLPTYVTPATPLPQGPAFFDVVAHYPQSPALPIDFALLSNGELAVTTFLAVELERTWHETHSWLELCDTDDVARVFDCVDGAFPDKDIELRNTARGRCITAVEEAIVAETQAEFRREILIDLRLQPEDLLSFPYRGTTTWRYFIRSHSLPEIIVAAFENPHLIELKQVRRWTERLIEKRGGRFVSQPLDSRFTTY